jgi:hypothetical protein
MPVRRSERRRRLSLSRIADIHVWTIISDPRRDPQKLLMVNFTTWEPHLELESLRAKGRIQFLDPLAPELLGKIRSAALQSTTLPLENADILLDQELVD